MEYPRSALLYLRHTKNTPDELKIMLHTPGGEISWKIPVMKSQEYSVDDIFEKHLYMLIPFYLLTYEKQLSEIAKSHERIMKLKQEYEMIFGRLEKARQDGFLNGNQWFTIRNLSKRICNHLTGNYRELNTEVRSVMGGEVIEYEGRQFVLAVNRKIAEKEAEGMSHDMAKNMVEGMLEGMVYAIRNLMVSSGMAVEQAMDALGIPAGEQPGYKEMVLYLHF